MVIRRFTRGMSGIQFQPIYRGVFMMLMMFMRRRFFTCWRNGYDLDGFGKAEAEQAGDGEQVDQMAHE